MGLHEQAFFLAQGGGRIVSVAGGERELVVHVVDALRDFGQQVTTTLRQVDVTFDQLVGGEV